MILSTLSPYFQDDLVRLRRFLEKPSLWENEINAVIQSYVTDTSTDEAIGAVQKARRLIQIFLCGLENNSDLRERLASAPLSNWADFQEPPAPRDTQDRLADMLYVVESSEEVPLLEIGDQARYIGARLFERCVRDTPRFDVYVDDGNFLSVLLEATDARGVEALAAYTLEMRMPITTRIMVYQNLPERAVLSGPDDKQKLLRTLLKPYRDRARSHAVRWILTSVPTRRDAAVDGIAYEAYTDLYFKMCDQPWDAIKEAQYRLIEKLNATKVLRFTNSDGTDLTMNIDGFTFCNSTIARNIPGSEVFSAPSIDSTNGVIVAKGRFAAKGDNGHIMENLTLKFENGYLKEALAETGQEHLDHAIDTDEGSRRIGEIGIGTNPYLKQHVASILLSEKIGGSFHVALGDAYTMTDYMGDPVRVDNGNRSLLHWDITTMLYGKAGMIYADGTLIMQNGIFTAAELDVLNRGWAALPFDERPPVWQKLYPSKE
ncbi:MAG: leucyl aminopeptidase [Proteobacteria bacterium]|nr:leucyl aminopeptidase [Pseudomonadota bacterium]